MTGLIAFLLVLWLAIAVVGAVVEGLLWVTLVGLILLVATGVYVWVKRKTSTTTTD